MLKGFREFVLRGNVVELATAVIIGAAFTAIVTAFTTNIISPLLAAIPTGKGCGQEMAVGEDQTQAAAVQVCGLQYSITGADETTLDFGAVVSSIINFLIVAAVIYFLIIVPYNKLNELAAARRSADATEEAELTEVGLLTEIRDLLTAPAAAAPTAKPLDRLPPMPNPAPGQYPPEGPGRHEL
ncbi:large conductance mechanosensitive channel protein MscL [Gordonia sp. (in: high G+C Gram-positive bacteria)]|uniref:large conductance mechanosensitive channel protein MscL n=1 Tax=Gordonia sp. (in: high G+C Gram-positive bacteria) TaxID=84139 RepID=UPI0039E4B27B